MLGFSSIFLAFKKLFAPFLSESLKMRSFTSFLLIFLLTVSGLLPVLAQKNELPKKLAAPVAKKPKYVPVDTSTTFDTVESFTEGRGAWVRWRMIAEKENAGFYVYRIAKHEQVVSEFIMGSAFSAGSATQYGNEYSFFDPNGSQNSQYVVQSQGMKGDSARSLPVVPVYVENIEKIKGGVELREELLRNAPGANLTANDIALDKDLGSEVIASLIVPDPDKHLEVISQPGVRIAAKKNGIVRVTRAQLQSAGFDVNADPNLWSLYLQGVELPLIIGPGADYIEFLGKSLDTVESDIRSYYLTVGSQAGRRIPTYYARPPQATVVSTKYNQTFLRKDRTAYVNQIMNGDLENYWGSIVGASTSTLNFNLSGIDRTAGTRKMRFAFQGFTFTPHIVTLTLNGTPLESINGTGRQTFSGELNVPVSLLLDGNNVLQMRSVWDNPSTPSTDDINLLDNFSIDFPRGYVAENGRLDFYTDNYKNALVSGFASSDVRVFDVTNENEPRMVSNLEIVQTGATWGPKLPAARGRVYYATEATNFAVPTSVTPNDPAMLGLASNAGTFLVITHPDFMIEAQAWAAYRAGQGISTKVVSVEEIYDEYNYGTLSSFAIEDFLLDAKTNWQTPPSYVLFVGDASHDSRNYSGTGYWNMVPSRMVNTLYNETGSDEALADFNNDGLAELAVGRISSRVAVGVTNSLTKTIAWESSLTPTSMDRGALFAYDLPNGYDFEAMSNRIMSNLPVSIQKTTVRRCDPNPANPILCLPNTGRQAEVLNAINEVDVSVPANSGQFLVNYSGHGTAAAWENTGFFSVNQVPQLTNAANPSIFTALTCLNGYFMALNNESFAETLLKAPNGGAVAVWASTGLTTPDVQEVMATRFYAKITEGNITRIGDLIADAKAQVVGGGDVRLSWALLGDPMLKVR